MKTNLILFSSLLLTLTSLQGAKPAFTYIEVDDAREKWGDFAGPTWLRYFGADALDVNQDGYHDILSGRYVYLSPGGDLQGPWERVDLRNNTDGILFLNVDGDALPDGIAISLPSVYWIEAVDSTGQRWFFREIAQVEATGHINSQGFRVADLVPGGRPEILLGAGDGLHVIEIPDEPESGLWPSTLLIPGSSDEGFDTGDIDGDGDLDLVASSYTKQGDHQVLNQLYWWENPGSLSAKGRVTEIFKSKHDIDRIEVADFNGDGRLDIAYAEERYPGKEPDAELVWLAAPEDPVTGKWTPALLITQYSMNNLGAGDIDGDGDIDLVTNEHKGSVYTLQLFENDGTGTFRIHKIDTGKEMHLGARLVDLDGDGDLDIYGPAWDHYAFLHVWRNDG